MKEAKIVNKTYLNYSLRNISLKFDNRYPLMNAKTSSMILFTVLSGKNKVIEVVTRAHSPVLIGGKSALSKIGPQFATGSLRNISSIVSVHSAPVLFL